MATIPMLNPQGLPGTVPADKAEAASKAGYVPAFKVLNPEGKPGWVPKDKVRGALGAKYRFFDPAEEQRYQKVTQPAQIAPLPKPRMTAPGAPPPEALETLEQAGRKAKEWAFGAAPTVAATEMPVAPKLYTVTVGGKAPAGLRTPGNIDINNRPMVQNGKDTSTVWSATFGTDQGVLLLPRVSDGEDGKPPHLMSNQQTWEHFKKYHKHLGVFASEKDAEAYSWALHEQQAKLKPVNGRAQTELAAEPPRAAITIPHPGLGGRAWDWARNLPAYPGTGIKTTLGDVFSQAAENYQRSAAHVAQDRAALSALWDAHNKTVLPHAVTLLEDLDRKYGPKEMSPEENKRYLISHGASPEEAEKFKNLAAPDPLHDAIDAYKSADREKLDEIKDRSLTVTNVMRGMGGAARQVADGLTTPENMAILFALSEGAGMPRWIHMLASAKFTYDQAKGALEGFQRGYAAAKNGDALTATMEFTAAPVDALFAFLTGHSLVGDAHMAGSLEYDARKQYGKSWVNLKPEDKTEILHRKTPEGAQEHAARVTEYRRTQAETRAKEAALPGRPTETTEATRRGPAIRAAKEAKRAEAAMAPPPAPAPPEETLFGAKLKTAMEKPIAPPPETAESTAEERVAEEVRKAAETSRPPTLDDVVYEFAAQRNLNPDQVAEDIRAPKHGTPTGEEKVFLANYGLWKTFALTEGTNQMRAEASHLRDAAMHTADADRAEAYAAEAAERQKGVDRTAAKLGEELAKGKADKEAAKTAPMGDPIFAQEGQKTVVRVPGREAPLGAVYAMVRRSGIKTSHDPFSFKWTPEYPRLLQERDLQSDEVARLDTQQNSRPEEFRVSTLLNPTETAGEGPPILLTDGLVAGGNRRMLMLMRALADASPEQKLEILSEINAAAARYGIGGERAPMDEKDPWILVRILDERPQDMTELAILGNNLNRNFTLGFTTDAKAVMNGRRIKAEDIKQIARWIDDEADEKGPGTLTKAMNAKPQAIYEWMKSRGIIEPGQEQPYQRKGLLTSRARAEFEAAILGHVLDDADALALATPALKGKLEGALAPLVEMQAAGDDWDVTDFLKHAVQLWNEIEPIRASYDDIGEKRESVVDKHLVKKGEERKGQTQLLFEDLRLQRAPVTRALAKLLDMNGLRVRRALQAYIAESEKGLFRKPDAREAFNEHIGKAVGMELHPLDWLMEKPATEEAKAAFDRDEEPHLATPEQRTATKTANLPEPEAAQAAAAETLAAAVENKTVSPASLETFFKAHDQLRAWAQPLMKIFGEIVPRATGRSLPDFLMKAFEEVRQGAATGRDAGAKGAYDWASKTMEMFKGADAVTAAHEFFHAMRHFMNERDLGRLEAYTHEMLRRAGKTHDELKAMTGVWTPEKDEILARAWERYLTEGEPPVETLRDIFARLKAAFKDTYRRLTAWEERTGVEIELTPEARAVFDRWFGKEELKIEPPPLAALTETPPETIESLLLPGEKTNADPLIETKPSINDVEGPQYAVRFDLAEGAPYARARSWMQLNEEKLKAFEAWVTTEGSVVAVYKAVEGEKLYQKMSRAEIETEMEEAPMEPPPIPGTEAMTPLPGTTEVVELKGAEGGKATEREREVSHADIGVREPARAGGVAEPAGRPADREALAAGETGGRARPGARARAERKESAPLRYVLEGAVSPENAHPLKPPEPPAIAPEQWTAKTIEGNIPANTPMPVQLLDSRVARVLTFPGQHELGDVIYSGLQQHDGVVSASPSGMGKTYLNLAVAKQMQMDGAAPQILVVTINRTSIEQASGWKGVARDHFGMTIEDLPESEEKLKKEGAYAMTYDGLLRNPWAAKHKWDLVIMDESQEVRNWHTSQQGALAKDLSDAAKKAIYVSATPFHVALEYGYMTKLGLWGKHSKTLPDFESWAKQFGAKKEVTEKTVWENGRQKKVKEEKWVRNGMNPKKLLLERERLIERGQFATQTKNMDGYTAQIVNVPVTPEMHAEMGNIRTAFTLAERYYEIREKPGLAAACRRNAATFMKMYLERKKLPEAMELAKQLREQGWQVALTSATHAAREKLYNFLKDANDAMKADGSGGIEALIPDLPGVLETMQKELGEEKVANYSGPYSAKREEALKNWRTGYRTVKEAGAKPRQEKNEAPFLYVSHAAGGAAVNMHDVTPGGTRPVAVIYLGPDYSGIVNEQLAGRFYRHGTNSDVFAVHMTSNAVPEVLMTMRIADRMEALHAAVNGIASTRMLNEIRRNKDVREATAGFELGNEVTYDAARFLKTVEDLPMVNYKEVRIPSAETAKGKGMKYPSQRAAEEGKAPERFLSVEESKAVIESHEMMQRLVDGEGMPIIGDELKDWDRGDRQILADTIGPRVLEAISAADDDEKMAAARSAIRIGMKEVLAAGRAGNIKLTPEGERMVWEMTAPGEPRDAEDVKKLKEMGVAAKMWNYFKRSGAVTIEAMCRRAGMPELGKEFRRRIDGYYADAQTTAGKLKWRYSQIIAENELTKGEHERMVMAIEGTQSAPNERVARATQQVRALFKEVLGELAERGLYFEDRNENGEVERVYYEDILENPRYWPRMWDATQKHILRDPVSGETRTVTLKELLGDTLSGLKRERLIGALQEKMGKSRSEVERFLADRRRRTKTAGNLEHARKSDLQLYRLDAEVAYNYFDQVGELLAREKHFGQRGEKVDGMLAKIPHEQPRKVAREIMDTILRPEPWKKGSALFFGGGTIVEMFTKMPFSVGKAWTHGIHSTLVLGSVKPMLRGILAGVTSPREVYRLAKMCGVIQHQSILDSDLAGSLPGKGAHWFMQVTGTDPIYRLQRALLNAGVQQTMERDILPKLRKKTKGTEYLRRLARDVLLLDDVRIDQAIKNGKWTEEDLHRGGAAAVNKIMFNVKDPTQMPAILRVKTSEIGSLAQTLIRPAYSLGSFQFKAAQLIRETLWNETRQGNWRPLAHFVTVYPVAGLMMGLTMASVKTVFQATMYQLFPASKPEDWKSPLEQLTERERELVENPTWQGYVKEYFTNGADMAAATQLRALMDTFIFVSENRRMSKFKVEHFMSDELERVFGPQYSDVFKAVYTSAMAIGDVRIDSGDEEAVEKRDKELDKLWRYYVREESPVLRMMVPPKAESETAGW